MKHDRNLLAFALWLGLLAAGSLASMTYDARPDAATDSAAHWPAEAGATRGDGWTLVVFVHAGCACTRATVHNLGTLMNDLDSPLSTTVIVRAPNGLPVDDWDAATRDWPARRLILDRDGDRARAFGVVTSGHALLYDADGARRFDGGVTALRGHEGPAAGLHALRDVLARRRTSAGPFPVFGCRIHRTTAAEGDPPR